VADGLQRLVEPVSGRGLAAHEDELVRGARVEAGRPQQVRLELVVVVDAGHEADRLGCEPGRGIGEQAGADHVLVSVERLEGGVGVDAAVLQERRRRLDQLLGLPGTDPVLDPGQEAAVQHQLGEGHVGEEAQVGGVEQP